MTTKFPLNNFLLGVTLVFLCSCASDVANRYYGSQRYPAKPFREVEVLSENPNRPFELIADFQARGASPKNMRKRAAKIGADAVIIQTLGGRYDLGDQWAGEDSQSKSYSRITATAIKYK